jgi:sterol desaturase/sphingolipid hydroxylase (fatty acid hydroxylase superfamily)
MNAVLAGDEVLALFPLLWVTVMSYSLFFMQYSFPAQRIEGTDIPKQVPFRHAKMAQHKLMLVDISYMALNSVCMPGLFYHFVCIMRSWGLDFSAPPTFGIYPTSPNELLTETAPQLLAALSVYLLSYEFVYYWWHRAMHDVPMLYKWVHKHHHQTSYPDRAAVDTFNTGCIESQVRFYVWLRVRAARPNHPWPWARHCGYTPGFWRPDGLGGRFAR